jgi:hypothetical protein
MRHTSTCTYTRTLTCSLYPGLPKFRVRITNITETQTANRRRLLATIINVDFEIRVPFDETLAKTEQVVSFDVSVTVCVSVCSCFNEF